LIRIRFRIYPILIIVRLIITLIGIVRIILLRIVNNLNTIIMNLIIIRLLSRLMIMKMKGLMNSLIIMYKAKTRRKSCRNIMKEMNIRLINRV
jgi:hypothetical protein